MRKAYNTLQEEQIPDIYYLTKEEIGIPADGMVDGVHSTDLGMQQYADSYLKKIREILTPTPITALTLSGYNFS